MISNDPSIDPSLQTLGDDLSQVHVPIQGDAAIEVETTYLQDLIEAAPDVTSDEQSLNGRYPEQTTAASDGMQPASSPLKRPRHDLTVGVQNMEEQHGAASGHDKKRRKRVAETTVETSSNGHPQTRGSPLPSSTSSARLAGAQPAPAIFRAPTGKKSTRPAVAKEFRNLELCPESFHKLQAYAKKHMLDPAHPERKTYVGNRGHTDTAQVRHDLQKCVREFLENGPGDEFFGPQSTDPTGEEQTGARSRGFSWPADKDLIIQLCSPLLRRMIVNERQREYALKTRGAGKTPEVGDKQVRSECSLQEYVLTLPKAIVPSVQIYLVDRTGKQNLCDRIDVSLTADNSWDMMRQTIHQQLVMLGQHNSESSSRLQVHTADGLETVEDSQAWQRVSQQVMEVEWLEGTIKVVVSISGST